MPRSTLRWGFESKVFDAACRLSVAMAGSLRCFIVVFDADGAARQVHVGTSASGRDTEAWDRLKAEWPSWFFFHPFDWPEYCSIEWRDVGDGALGRFLGVRFDPADLPTDHLGRQQAGQHLSPPSSWDVMI